MTDNQLHEIFESAVDAVKGRPATEQALREGPAVINGDSSSVCLLAIGKASSSMAAGALAVLGERITRGLVVSKYHHIDATVAADPRLTCIESAHPMPDQQSLIAGEKVAEFVGSVMSSERLLVLISGGASALMEQLPAGMTLSDLRTLNEFLLAGGYDIHQMNRVRREFSLLKGGRLAALLGDVQTTQLLISDVPGDAPASIGSGPLIKPPAASDDDSADQINLSELPASLSRFLDQRRPAPAAADPVWQRIDTHIIASISHARQQAGSAAQDRGMPVILSDGDLYGDATEMASRIADILGNSEGQSGVYIWGGETTVMLPDNPGRGGRNQHLALALADAMPAGIEWSALCCGTDGTDGPTADAGGCVNATTTSKLAGQGIDVAQCLVRADAGTALAAVNQLVTTGPTGTNVMDLVIAVRE